MIVTLPVTCRQVRLSTYIHRIELASQTDNFVNSLNGGGVAFTFAAGLLLSLLSVDTEQASDFAQYELD